MADEWAVSRDAWGRVVVVDGGGEVILVVTHSDPVRALEIGHLAAQSPAFRSAVAPLVRRLERIEVDHGIPLLHRDSGRIGIAWMALHASTPPAVEMQKAAASSQQVELHWNDVA